MAHTTPVFALPYPDAADRADVPHDMQLLADRLDALLLSPATVQMRVEKGTANGYAGLDANGRVPAAQLPPAADLSGFELIAHKGQPNGYAGLDGNARVPLAQLDTNALEIVARKGVANGYPALDGGAHVPLAQLDTNALEVVTRKGQPNGYASLDGTGKVPAAQLPIGGDANWAALGLGGGWTAPAAGGNYTPARYRKLSSGLVNVQAFLQWTGGGAEPPGGQLIATLPAGYRPAYIVPCLALASGNAYGVSARVDVAPNGQMAYLSGANVNQMMQLNVLFFAEA